MVATHGMSLLERSADMETPAIFIVDDDTRSMEAADAILRGAGYSTATFHDGESAFEAFSKLRKKPALLMTDYSMGEMNGVELMDRCRRICPNLKVVMVSGTLDHESWEKFPFKVDAFIEKPYSPAKVSATIEAVLAQGEGH